jgi:hypothetical protein
MEPRVPAPVGTREGNRALIGVLARAEGVEASSTRRRHVTFIDESFGQYIGIDPWGEPYRIVFAGDDGLIIDGNHRLKDNVAVWSSGQNGVDERGAGDDIASWSDPPM